MSIRWRWETTRTPSGSGNDTVIAVFVTNNPSYMPLPFALPGDVLLVWERATTSGSSVE